VSAKVVVRDLEKRYGGVHAAQGVSFEIPDGEVFGLLGPNGAGKTTTLECVIGLREPDSGHIEVCGIDARRRPREVKRRIGAALQTTALQPRITPREALRLFGSFYPVRADPGQLLTRFALTDKADVAFDTLSSGQRQRLALALAFVNNPELVFLDEPTAGLDAQTRRELRGQVAGMKQQGHTVLMTTHDLAEAQEVCDRIAIIHRGRIVATGAPRELTARSGALSSVTLWTSQPLDRDAVAALPGVEDLMCDGASTRFRTADSGRTLAELTRWLRDRSIDVTELHVQKATLEDVFLELTGADR
jgi:ABC-2 type transport system ATP-binding protein